MRKETLKLLIVDDEPDYRDMLRILLIKQGYTADTASSADDAVKRMETQTYDILLTDLMMAGTRGDDLVGVVKARFPDTECIVITGYGSIDNAVETIKRGAFSYIIKSGDPQELLIEIGKIEKIKALSQENKRLKSEISNTAGLLQSKSEAFCNAVHYAEKAAETQANILILGESGVGKEVFARHIHHISSRRNEVFMAVNCHALSDTLLESELYGHEKGAFTGSQNRRIGRFEGADGGTLFLDEIGDMPASTQVKILRNIENREIERIGSNHPIPVDFRLISATNRNLVREIAAGRFREDLYYRINTVALEIPPLRKRKEDLPMLVTHFIQKAGQELKKNISGVDGPLMDRLMAHDYPGNIRELKNIIERLMVLAEGDVLTLAGARQYDVISGSQNPHPYGTTLREARKHAERSHILQILKAAGGNIDEAAKRLDISSRQLYNKIKEYEIPTE